MRDRRPSVTRCPALAAWTAWQHIHRARRDREALPADVWLIVYMHGGIDGKHVRRLAHACRQMCAAASAHEDNITPAQPPLLLSDPLPALPADVWLKVYMHGGINGKHARRLALAKRLVRDVTVAAVEGGFNLQAGRHRRWPGCWPETPAFDPRGRRARWSWACTAGPGVSGEKFGWQSHGGGG